MTDKANCAICNGQDLRVVMTRVKGIGYTHSTCIWTATEYLKIKLNTMTWTEIQSYILANRSRK